MGTVVCLGDSEGDISKKLLVDVILELARSSLFNLKLERRKTLRLIFLPLTRTDDRYRNADTMEVQEGFKRRHVPRTKCLMSLHNSTMCYYVTRKCETRNAWFVRYRRRSLVNGRNICHFKCHPKHKIAAHSLWGLLCAKREVLAWRQFSAIIYSITWN